MTQRHNHARGSLGGAKALVAALATAAVLTTPATIHAQGMLGKVVKRAVRAAARSDDQTAAMQQEQGQQPATAGGAAPAAAAPAYKPVRAAAQRANAAQAATAQTATAQQGAAPAARQQASAQPAAATTAPGAATPVAGTPRYAATAGPGTKPGQPTVSVTEAGTTSQLTFSRETFEYAGRGRRDPFVSLMKSGELRPLFSDLKLVTVLYDPTGRNSVAIMRDVYTKDQYRVKVGQTLGRMRVSQIQPKQVVFALEEFGYGRQEVLALTDSTTARKK